MIVNRITIQSRQTHRLTAHLPAVVPMHGNDPVALEVTVDIDHDGLVELIRKAARNKTGRSKDGPVTVRVERTDR